MNSGGPGGASGAPPAGDYLECCPSRPSLPPPPPTIATKCYYLPGIRPPVLDGPEARAGHGTGGRMTRATEEESSGEDEERGR